MKMKMNLFDPWFNDPGSAFSHTKEGDHHIRSWSLFHRMTIFIVPIVSSYNYFHSTYRVITTIFIVIVVIVSILIIIFKDKS